MDRWVLVRPDQVLIHQRRPVGFNEKKMFQLHRTRFLTAVRRVIATCLLLAVTCSPVHAQRSRRSADERPKSYVPVYIVIMASVGLALTLICRTSRRTIDFRNPDA
jgi:hypothetical protein